MPQPMTWETVIPVIPSFVMASFRAYSRSSLKMISTLVNLLPSGSKEGSRLTGTASATGVVPVTATISSLEAKAAYFSTAGAKSA